MKIGLIGIGNLARAMIPQWKGENLLIFDLLRSSMESCLAGSSDNISLCASASEVVLGADILFLAVKPKDLSALLNSIKSDLEKHRPLTVSLAVGKSLRILEALTPLGLPLARVMPNLNAAVGASATGFALNNEVSPAQKQALIGLLIKLGGVTEIPEHLFGVFSAVAASSPAFTFMYIDALAQAAQRAGMPREMAVKAASESVLGSAKTLLNTHNHPRELVDNVCSPGGTTIEGIACLEQSAFSGIIIKTVYAVLQKEAAMSELSMMETD